MSNSQPVLEELWKAADFEPNPEQRKAIEHIGGPLFLTAGPGSGKTRVLLWRTLNLLVYHQVKPEEIFLSTFTEKAALQLKEGLRALLGYVTERTGSYYDLANAYIGTLHSLCQRLIADRRFSPDRLRPKAPLLIDELSQYLHLYRDRTWQGLISAVGWKDANAEINDFFDGYSSRSRHYAVSNCISLFNRFSEECLDPTRIRAKADDARLIKLIDLYVQYRESLLQAQPPLTDFALLQQEALSALEELDRQAGENRAGYVFKHVIIDEYQDTNTIQEKLIFRLASGHKQVCVVGDDDQALYRFRGATVENFVEFPSRCRQNIGTDPTVISLETNYRSRKKIVTYYCDFITHPTCDWRRSPRSKSFYRVPKDLKAHRGDDDVAVIASDPAEPVKVCAEIAKLVRKLLDSGKVEDPNKIAFLYPSLKSAQVSRMKEALESVGTKVYAPRAGTFLQVEEAVLMLGLFMHVFGKPERGDRQGRDYSKFYDWVDVAYDEAKPQLSGDPALSHYVKARQDEIEGVIKDYKTLVDISGHNGWDLKEPYNPDSMRNSLLGASRLSKKARKTLMSPYVDRLIRSRAKGEHPFSLKYIILRATSLDWNVLDLFYHICGFKAFRKMFDQAENVKKDEGPVCNLSLLSQYLARFLDEYNVSVLSAEFLADDKFQRTFFASYLYALFRRGEGEYENAEDPFPRGRVPFLTIHQAKGLEFPVVVLGNPRKRNDEPQRIEEIVQPLVNRRSEPLDRMAEFDVMRMFYVALSRAQNLLVIAHYAGRGQSINEPFSSMLDNSFPRIRQFDVQSLPEARQSDKELPKTYSYTGDYLLYKRCPRQYMAFRKYVFAPARSQTMFFGSLVHQTIDDLHQHLISLRGGYGQQANG
jgi:DNA helicase-2/ATP-dependent DNA helicase PcrA